MCVFRDEKGHGSLQPACLIGGQEKPALESVLFLDQSFDDAAEFIQAGIGN